MRQKLRIVVLSLLSVLSAAVLTAVAAILSAVSLAATALIVPGTGTPDANSVSDYREHFVDRYSAPFNPSCTSENGCTLTGVDYPASFWPLGFIGNWCPGYQCDKWNESVGAGVASVIANLQNLNDPDGAILMGYSQGGAVVSDALRELAGNSLLDKVKAIVLIGNAYNPDGGIFIRLGFLPTIPILNITFGPPTPTDIGKPMVAIGFEYDPVMYAPKYWGNLLSVVNAFAAFETVHGYYLTPNGNSPEDGIAYGYDEAEIDQILKSACPGDYCRVDANGNHYFMIPAKSLPMYDLLMSSLPAPLQPIVRPLVDFLTPVTEVLVDLGYDWSGDPGKPQWLSPLPFSPTTNFVKVGFDLVGAIGQGIENVLGGGAKTAVVPPQNDNDNEDIKNEDTKDENDVEINAITNARTEEAKEHEHVRSLSFGGNRSDVTKSGVNESEVNGEAVDGEATVQDGTAPTGAVPENPTPGETPADAPTDTESDQSAA